MAIKRKSGIGDALSDEFVDECMYYFILLIVFNLKYWSICYHSIILFDFIFIFFVLTFVLESVIFLWVRSN
jgi:hypothetical protein